MFKKLGYACNPYLPGKEHVPDGEPRIFGGRLYVFGSHDEIGGDRYCAGSYVGWSAPLTDLSDWQYEGVILKKGLDPMDPNGTKDYYAPDVIQGSDGRYYLYYSIEGSMVISVAVSEKPTGEYQFYGHVKDRNDHVIGASEGDIYQFDPALLNDNGRIYLYSGQGIPIQEMNGRKVKGATVCELDADMLTVKSEQRVITSNDENCFKENPFFEASSIRKIGDKYYFVYSPLPNTHFLCYAVSDYPDKDFVYGGVLVSNADIFPNDEKCQEPMNYWGNNHGGLLELEGELYIFYHRNSNRTPYARQGCVEKIMKGDKGELLQAELTSTGLRQEAFKAKGEYAAYIACHLRKRVMHRFVPFQFLEYDDEDPYIAEEDDTEIPFIANLHDGAMARYRYFSFDGTEQRLFISCRGNGEGVLKVSTDTDVLTEVLITPQITWTTFEANLLAREGVFAITLTYQGSSAVDILSFGIE